jgi:hypothetical protein
MDFRELILDLLGTGWVQGLILLGAAALCWFGLDWLSWQAILWWGMTASHVLLVMKWAGFFVLLLWGLALLAAPGD